MVVPVAKEEEEYTKVFERKRELLGKKSDQKREEIFSKNLKKYGSRNFNRNNLCGMGYFGIKIFI